MNPDYPDDPGSRRWRIGIASALLLSLIGAVFGCMPGRGPIQNGMNTLEAMRITATYAALDVTRAVDPALREQNRADADELTSSTLNEATNAANRLFFLGMLMTAVAVLTSVVSYIVIKFMLVQVLIAVFQAQARHFYQETEKFRAKINNLRPKRP